MDTYMQTAVCCQPTNVLVLELSHYRRILAGRPSNAPVLAVMKEDIKTRLEMRISRMRMRSDKSVPLFERLLEMTAATTSPSASSAPHVNDVRGTANVRPIEWQLQRQRKNSCSAAATVDVPRPSVAVGVAAGGRRASRRMSSLVEPEKRERQRSQPGAQALNQYTKNWNAWQRQQSQSRQQPQLPPNHEQQQQHQSEKLQHSGPRRLPAGDRSTAATVHGRTDDSSPSGIEWWMRSPMAAGAGADSRADGGRMIRR